MRGTVLTSLVASATTAYALVDCSFDAIQSILPDGVVLGLATPIEENGTFTVPAGDTGWPTDPINLPKLCAVAVTVSSDVNGTYGFGIFLPDNWNNRTLYVILSPN